VQRLLALTVAVFLLPVLLALACATPDDESPRSNAGQSDPAVFALQNESTPQPPTGEQNVEFGNGLVQITFCADTGRIVQVSDLRRTPPLNLLDEQLPAGHLAPVELQVIRQRPILPGYKTEFLKLPKIEPVFTHRDDALVITWDHAPPLPLIEATWTVADDEPELRSTVRLELRDDTMYTVVRYPILPGLASLSGDKSGDQYLTSSEGGFVLNNPLAYLVEDDDDATSLVQQRYPAGHGAMTQLTAYLAPGTGGMLLYTADGDFHVKAFTLRHRPPQPTQDDVTVGCWQVDHYNADVRDEAGSGEFAVDYPTVLRWLDHGDWAEAASVYREWSDQQVWASDPIAEREPDERAFFKQLGASIFGLSSRIDHRPWIREFHNELVEGFEHARLLFVPAWDFHPHSVERTPYLYCFYQGGWHEDYWLPLVDASYDNLDEIRGQGDWAMPFLYDLIMHSEYPGWNHFTANPTSQTETGSPWDQRLLINADGQPGGFVYWLPRYPGNTYTLCPAEPEVAAFWQWRDELLINHLDPPLDGLYFDLGFGVVTLDCFDHLAGAEHGHPSGSGAWLIESIRNALDVERGTPNPRGYRYGAENAAEPYVDLVDFHHLGASGTGPLRECRRIEQDEPIDFYGYDRWIVEGGAEHVPLFSFVHHHSGNVRTGGKMQISYDIGEVFYWIAGAEYLWGGVVELIYFNTPVDWLPGLDGQPEVCPVLSPCAFQASWSDGPKSPRGWYHGDEVRRADPDKLRFLRDAIELRVESPAAPYLTMGRMEPPPQFDPMPIKQRYEYDYYSAIRGVHYNHAGWWDAAPLLVTAWRHPYEETVAVLLANTWHEEVATTLVIDPARYGFADFDLWLVDLAGGEDSLLGTALGGETITLPVSLPPRSFAMLELVPTH